MSTVQRRSFGERMIGAARLNIDVYEEVEADQTATGQAALVVGMVAVALSIGRLEAGPIAIVLSLIAAFLGWLFWSGVTYVIGDKLLHGTATWGELMRTLGFAQAPGVLFVLIGVPGLGPFGPLVQLAVLVWLLITGIVAIRQALDFGTGKAILTAVLGVIAYAVAVFLPLMLIGAGMAAVSR